MRPTRRNFLALMAAALGAGPAATACFAAAPQPALRELGARKRLVIGSAMSVQELNPADRALFVRQVASITPEVSMKMTAIRPARDVWRFQAADALAAFAAESKLAMRGHALIWNNSQQPAWLKALSAQEIRAVMQEHIERTMSRYTDTIQVWDVINEPIGDAQYGPYWLREGPFLDKLGVSYIADSFRMARAASPAAKLVLNETHTERGDNFGLGFRRNLLTLIARLQDEGVPLDGIGLQGHLPPRAPFDPDGFLEFLAEIERRGLFIEITELDVDDSAFPDSVEERDRLVADAYRRFLSRVLENRAVRSVTFWQLGDRASWYFSRSVYSAPASPRRPRPLLYDLRMEPKPAFDAVAAALEAMPPRDARM